jgi:hypothetical protein
MNLAVIAPCYYSSTDPYKLLTDSCAHHHLPLYPFGGPLWQGDSVAHFQGALQAIRNLPSIYDLVMFTDAGDTFVMGGADEIEAKFQMYGCEFLMSAEQDLYPWGLEEQWASSEKRPSSEPPWQYLNGGGWVARRESAEKLVIYAASAQGDEAQSKWISAYCSGEFQFRLDHQCQIFQTMSGSSKGLEWEGRRLINTVTNTRPVVVHFNGKLGGIQEFYKEAYGR